MKRIGRSRSGREMYGSKWQNTESTTSETDSPSLPQTHNENQTHESSQAWINQRRIPSNHHQSMYRACIEGDYVAAEMLLEGTPSLSSDEINEEGDRALHVAVSMKHKQLVRKLVERMSPSELASLDGHGYTACCYAAISGAVNIANLLIKKNPTLVALRDGENKTPLQKAALRGKAKMVSFLLEHSKVEDLSTQEWFDLLLATVRRKIYGVALEILGTNEQLAIMSNKDGTALHLLAGQYFYETRWEYMRGVMQRDMRSLAKALWTVIQGLGQSTALDLMKNPPILHDAAQVGNIQLICMLTHTFPDIIRHTNHKGYTIFHIAVKNRHESFFRLFNEMGARKDFIALWQDEKGNNILHLVGELPDPKRLVLWTPALEMQRELLWFEKVKETVPPMCLEMKNKDGETPEELFSKKHKPLLEETRTWMRNLSDSNMLISTLIFSMVFGAAFAVPGGYNQETGIPLLLGTTNWFTCFIIFELLSIVSSAISILCFALIMVSPMKEDHFVNYLPYCYILGLNGLKVSVFSAVSVLISLYFLVYVEVKATFTPMVIKSIVIVIYVVIIHVVCYWMYNSINLPWIVFLKRGRYTLFKRNYKRKCFVF